MKTCFKCHRQLELSEFYVHPQMADGHLNKCKDCTKKDTADRVQMLSINPEWVEMELDRHREKSRRYRNDGRVVYSRDAKQVSSRRYDQANPHKKLAHGLVAKALASGKIKRQPCLACGSENSQAHHDDYEKPMDVMWLCPKHHAERHVTMRRKERLKIIH